MRERDPAVVGRLDAHRLLLDLRTVPDEQDDELYAAVVAVATATAQPGCD